jgi:hypothetical protein
MGRKAGVDVSESLVTATVTFGKTDTGFGLAVEIVAEIPGVDADVAADLVEQAHQFCPTPRPPAATSSPRHAWRDVMTKGLTTMVVSPFVIGGGRARASDVPPRARSRLRAGVAALVAPGAPGLVAEAAGPSSRGRRSPRSPDGVDHPGPSSSRLYAAPTTARLPLAIRSAMRLERSTSSRIGWRTCSVSISSADVRPARWAVSTLG